MHVIGHTIQYIVKMFFCFFFLNKWFVETQVKKIDTDGVYKKLERIAKIKRSFYINFSETRTFQYHLNNKVVTKQFIEECCVFY